MSSVKLLNKTVIQVPAKHKKPKQRKDWTAPVGTDSCSPILTFPNENSEPRLKKH